MRTLAFFGAVVCLISCYGMNAYAQPVEQSLGPHFVGASRAATTGDAGGVISMNQLCKSSFGNPAHMCNVDEFYSTAGASRKTEGLTMWVLPAFGNCVFATTPTPASTICLEQGTAAASPATLGATCSGWTSAAAGSGAPLGTTVNTFVTGPTVGVTNVTEACDAILPVACCSP